MKITHKGEVWKTDIDEKIILLIACPVVVLIFGIKEFIDFWKWNFYKPKNKG